MSCKLLNGEAGSRAAPVVWRNVTANGPNAAAAESLYAASATEAGIPPKLHQEIEWRLEEARTEWERRAQEAYQQGYREGDAAAGQKAQRDLQDRLEQLARTVELLGSYCNRMRREAEGDLVRLATAIARRILRRELSVDPEALLGIVKAGLEKLDTREIHRLRVHPEYVETITRFLGGTAKRIEVAGDAALEPGGAVFETSRGTLDSGLETQLAEIERGFSDLLPKENRS